MSPSRLMSRSSNSTWANWPLRLTASARVSSNLACENFFFFPRFIEFLLHHLRQPWAELVLAGLRALVRQALLVSLQELLGQADFFGQGDYFGMPRTEILLHGFEFGAGIRACFASSWLG